MFHGSFFLQIIISQIHSKTSIIYLLIFSRKSVCTYYSAFSK
jgi:hypothetical protein